MMRMWSSWALSLGCAFAAAQAAEAPRLKTGGPPVVVAAPAPAEWTVASININKETDVERIVAELRASEDLAKVDVLALQEVAEVGGVSIARSVAEKLNRHWATAALGADTGDGLALISRFPLDGARAIELPRNELVIRSRRRIALAATAALGDRLVRLIVVHLDTRINAARRLEQLEPALADARAFDGPAIVAGDFNTNAFLWIGHVLPIPFIESQAPAVVERLREQGFYTPFEVGGESTHQMPGFQLDWIFARGLRERRWGVAPAPFTDHRAVWVAFDRPDSR